MSTRLFNEQSTPPPVRIDDDLARFDSFGLLDRLLEDKTTGRNIIWGTSAYQEELGHGYAAESEIRREQITGMRSGVIKTRANKHRNLRDSRTKSHAEVFTPSPVVAQMNNVIDSAWNEDLACCAPTGEVCIEVTAGHKLSFASRHGMRWQDYVNLRILEITCGEGPFLTSRYDAETGDSVAFNERIGVLDRKLEVARALAPAKDFLGWAFKALQATYGYEFQGDNLLIARLNALATFEENARAALGREATLPELRKAATIISWNWWQMNGLTHTVPFAALSQESTPALFDSWDCDTGTPIYFSSDKLTERTRCRIYNWRSSSQRRTVFADICAAGKKTPMKFDFVIGNPPYQEETSGGNETYAPPCTTISFPEPTSFLTEFA